MDARGYVILGRLDIEGASDSVPHEHLSGALERLGIAFLPSRFSKTISGTFEGAVGAAPR